MKIYDITPDRQARMTRADKWRNTAGNIRLLVL
jgi:hypothetical protein